MEVLERAMAILHSEVIKDDCWASRCNIDEWAKQWQGGKMNSSFGRGFPMLNKYMLAANWHRPRGVSNPTAGG